MQDSDLGVSAGDRQRIFERFREERIRMPYPTRTVFLHEGRPGTDGAGERGAGA